MGRAKEDMLLREESAHKAAERAGRRCAICGSVVPFTEALAGPSASICAHCHNTMTKDD